MRRVIRAVVILVVRAVLTPFVWLFLLLALIATSLEYIADKGIATVFDVERFFHRNGGC